MADRDRRTDERPEPDEGFLQRWSRRKTEARSAAVTPAEDPKVAAEGEPAAQDEPAPVDPEDLPDIDSLDANSDFSVFMRPGVPEHLRTQALRKMWRTDPIFSKLDGLVEYGEDYTIQSWPKGAIRTAYQIGRGFVNELEKLGGAEPPPEAAEASAPPAGDAGAAIGSAAADEPPAKAGEDRSGSDAGSPQGEVEAASARAASVPKRRRRRPLPRRG